MSGGGGLVSLAPSLPHRFIAGEAQRVRVGFTAFELMFEFVVFMLVADPGPVCGVNAARQGRRRNVACSRFVCPIDSSQARWSAYGMCATGSWLPIRRSASWCSRPPPIRGRRAARMRRGGVEAWVRDGFTAIDSVFDVVELMLIDIADPGSTRSANATRWG